MFTEVIQEIFKRKNYAISTRLIISDKPTQDLNGKEVETFIAAKLYPRFVDGR